MGDKESWDKYELLVLDRLETHQNDLKSIEKNFNELKVEVALLKQKMLIIGAGTSLFVSAIVSVITAIVIKKTT